MGVSMSRSAVVNSNNRLACRTYRQLAKEHQGQNIFFSPLGMNSTLALIASGSRELTKKQLIHSLGGETAKELNSEYGSLLKHFNKGKRTSVIETIIFLHQFYQTQKKFAEIAKKTYGASVQQIDFSKDQKVALEQVNDWLNEASDGDVKELGVQLKPHTVLLITNFVYHHSVWKYKFNTALTHAANFFIDTTRSVSVKFMFTKGSFRYYFDRTLNCVTVALPYTDQTVMLIIVPQTVGGLPAVEAVFSKLFLERTISNMKEKRDLRVILPKFQLEETYSLVPTLKAIGITDLFTHGRANLMDLSNRDHHLYVSQFSHKAVIDVTEDGTKAKKISRTLISTVRADHPFLFVVCDKSNKMILFVGRVVNP